MGKGKRLKNRDRRPRRKITLGTSFAVVADADDAEATARAKSLAGDHAAKLVGAAIAGPITVRVYAAREGIELLTDKVAANDQRAKLLRFLRDNPHGALVAATVPADSSRLPAATPVQTGEPA
jgi:hypothetical protein